MDDLAHALTEAGGVRAPRERTGQLRQLLTGELRHGAGELQRPRSGVPRPVVVAFAGADGGAGRGLWALVPVDPALRADPDAVNERTWLLVAAAIGSMVEAGAPGPLTAGSSGAHLALAAGAVPGSDAADAELAALAFDEQAGAIDRLRARALAVPPHVLEDIADLRPPIGAGHPLLVAAEVARQGGRPADPASVLALEEAVLAVLQVDGPDGPRPHDDPDPARRIARRILQRLAGMGKWGGYHTEFVHLSRGFAPDERALAARVGEALLDSGLLAQKTSVGQRHVYLDPRAAPQIHALVDRGELPAALVLPSG